jgi:protein involved in polysaccharide export with SLBB domain
VKVFAINPVLQDIVYLSGHVAQNGPFQWIEGMKVTDIVSWDTVLPMPYLDYARIVRDILPDHHKAIIPFHLGKALSGDPQHNLALQPLDEIWIYSRTEIDRLPRINIFGEVKQPGPYYLLDGLRISDLIYNAGGFTPIASMKDAELTRYTINPHTNDVVLTHRLIDLEAAIRNDTTHNLLLQPYDALTVKAIPDAKIGATVTLDGEVRFPGTYTIAPGDRLSDVIERAGGYTDKAFLPGARLIRKSLAEEQRKQLDAFLLIQEQRLTAESAAIQAGGSLRKDEILAEQESLQQRKDLLHKLAQQVVVGRMVVSLDTPANMRGTWRDLQLENGDRLTIPTMPSSVGVIGSVYSQATFLYEPGKPGSYYLKRAGGLLEDANKKAIYVLKADGSAINADTAFDSMQPGDVIIVPPSTEGKVRTTSLVRDLASILGSLSITSAALVRIF